MKFREFLNQLDEGEGLHIEFKRKVSSPEKLAHELIAFANSSGGVLYVGIDDDRSITGVESEKVELQLVEQAAHEWCDPPVEYVISFFDYKNRDIICVEVPESDRKPHFLAGDDEPKISFVRVGEHSVQASKEMIKIMKHRSAGDSITFSVGAAEKRLFAYFEDHDRITVKEYAQLANFSERRASRLLIRLVRANVLAIHTMEKSDFYTLLHEPEV
jgi:predicted HTH transcriptional regulator